MTFVFILLGVVLNFLTIYAKKILPPADFDLLQLEGKYYEIGVASNNPSFTTRKDSLQMGVYNMKPEEAMDLSMRYERLQADGTCLIHYTQAKRAVKPGAFTFSSFSYNYRMIFHEVGDHHTFMYVKQVDVPYEDKIFKLLARDQTIYEDVKNRWREFVENYGISPENVIFLPRKDGCRA